MAGFSLDIAIQPHDQRWKTLLRPYCKTVRMACEAALRETKLARIPCQWEMAVVLADDAFIRELNQTYRGKNKPTNVLSFPSVPGIEGDAKRLVRGRDTFALGDLVLALETIEREAQAQGKRLRDHAAHLLVHGTLHLLGYDHEREKDAAAMERLEIKILKKLGINNPYL